MNTKNVSFFRGCSSGHDLDKILEDLKLNWIVEEVRPITGRYEKGCGGIKFYENKGIIRTDTCHPLSIMGTRFKIVQNKEIVSILKSFLDEEKLRITEGGFFKFGKRVWVSAELKNIKIYRFTILPKILLEWSYNGEVAISFKFIPELHIPNWKKSVKLASFIPGNPDIYGGYKFKQMPYATGRIRNAYKVSQKFFNELKIFYTSLYKSSFNPSQMEELLRYLYPDPDKIRVRKDGTTIKPYNEKRREDIIEKCKKFKKDFRFTKFIAILAFNYYFDYHSPIRVTKGTVEEEQRMMSILFGTAHVEKIRFLKAL